MTRIDCRTMDPVSFRLAAQCKAVRRNHQLVSHTCADQRGSVREEDTLSRADRKACRTDRDAREAAAGVACRRPVTAPG